MDLLELKSSVCGEIMELRHPATGEIILSDDGQPFSLTLLGADSDIYRSEIKRRFNEVQRQAKRKGKGDHIDLDEAEQKAAELLAKCTTDCYLQEDGDFIKCTFENMVRVYLNPQYKWLREQAEAFINDRGNFIKS